jgi:transposase
MVVEDIDVSKTLEKAKRLLKDEEGLSPALRAVIDVLILLVSILANRVGRNSRNSHKPPSQDPNRIRKKAAGELQKRKPGGQEGHEGRTLKRVDKPNAIEEIMIDRSTIPADRTYSGDGYESRQVIDVKIRMHVTEYRAEVLRDEAGNRYVAGFPEGVTKAVQYGHGVKAESVYLSQFQLIPLMRVQNHFADQMGLPLSKGSIANFNQEAFERLAPFEAWAREALLASRLNHADETGINIGGEKAWLHNLSSEKVTLYHADEKRGKEAMDRMGVLPSYTGYLCHDHWKPYYRYENVTHVLCNAHHLRELDRVIEEEGLEWARLLKDLLLEINKAVDDAGGALSEVVIAGYGKRYGDLLQQGEAECPVPPPKEPGKRGRQKKAFSRNLLERLRDFEKDTLRFMTEAIIPFTNNQGENDLRMTKVQQKISGCFRSMEGARIFCRVRSFLSTCRKNNVSPAHALRDLFQGNLPAFMT